MKRTLLLLCFLLSAVQSNSQNRFFQYGFITGASSVNLYGNPYIEAFLEPEWRITGGPAVYYPLSRHFSIKSNLFFESKGAGGIMPLFDKDGEPLGIFNTKVKYQYLTVPLLFDYYFGNRLKGNFTMGPWAGLLLSQKTTFTEPVSGEVIENKGTTSYIPWDGGIVLGAGLRYGLNKRITFSLDGRFDIGMTNIVSIPVLSSLTIYTLSSKILVGVYYTPGYNAGKVRNIPGN
jgi:Outer membrane protein beta-barrel domain